MAPSSASLRWLRPLARVSWGRGPDAGTDADTDTDAGADADTGTDTDAVDADTDRASR